MALCIPIAAAQAVLLNESILWSLLPALALISLAFLVSRGMRPSLTLFNVLAISWSLGSLLLALHLQSIAMGFLTLLLSSYSFLSALALRSALNQSYIDPKMKWYQGSPQAIHGLKCELKNLETTLELSVSQLDRVGAFIFSPSLQEIDWNKKNTSEMIFRFKNKEVHCKGKPARILKTRIGAGYRFSEMTVDMQKKLGDFVEALRGEGYVP